MRRRLAILCRFAESAPEIWGIEPDRTHKAELVIWSLLMP